MRHSILREREREREVSYGVEMILVNITEKGKAFSFLFINYYCCCYSSSSCVLLLVIIS